MSKTVSITSTDQFRGLLSSSRIVVADCTLFFPLLQQTVPLHALFFASFSLKGFPFDNWRLMKCRDSLCRLVRTVQADRAHLRTAVWEALETERYHLHQDQCGSAAGACRELWCHCVSTSLVSPPLDIFSIILILFAGLRSIRCG